MIKSAITALFLMKAKKILREIEQKSNEMFLPIVGREKGRFLQKLVKKYKPKNVLEVGSLVGYSAILMSQHMPADGKITTIEINPEAASMANENFEKAGAKNVNLILGDAMKVIPNLEGQYDLVFLDAEKNEYYNYLLLAENKLLPNAIIIADNVKIFEHEMKDYLDYVRAGQKYTSETHEFGDDAMEVSFKVS